MSNPEALNDTLISNPHALIPDGVFEFDATNQIFPRRQRMTISGNGPESTTLKRTNGVEFLNFAEAGTDGNEVAEIKVENLTIDMNGGGQRALQVDTQYTDSNSNTQWADIRDLRFENIRFVNLPQGTGGDDRAVWLRGIIKQEGVTFEDCTFLMDKGGSVDTYGIYNAQDAPQQDFLPDDTRLRVENCLFEGGGCHIYNPLTAPGRSAPIEVTSCTFRDKTSDFERVAWFYHTGGLHFTDNRIVNCLAPSETNSDSGTIWCDVAAYDNSEDANYTQGAFTETTAAVVSGNHFRSITGNALYVEDSKGMLIEGNYIVDVNERSNDSFSGPNNNVKSDGGHGILVGGGVDHMAINGNSINNVEGHGIFSAAEISAKSPSDPIRRLSIESNKISDVGQSVGPDNNPGTGIRIFDFCQQWNISGNKLRNDDGNDNPDGRGIVLFGANEFQFFNVVIEGNAFDGWTYGLHSPDQPTEGIVLAHNAFTNIGSADISWRGFVGVLGPNNHSARGNIDQVQSTSNWSAGQIFISSDSVIYSSKAGGLGRSGRGESRLQGTTVFKDENLSDGDTLHRWEGHRNVSLVRSGGTDSTATFDWRSDNDNNIRYVTQNNELVLDIEFDTGIGGGQLGVQTDPTETLNVDGAFLLEDDGADPDENGEIRRNGGDLKVYTGGSVLNLSDVSSGGGVDVQDDGSTVVNSADPINFSGGYFTVIDQSGEAKVILDIIGIAGPGLEKEIFNDELQISSDAAGDGLQGGSGSPLAVDSSVKRTGESIGVKDSATTVSDADPLEFAGGAFNVTNPSGSKARVGFVDEKIEDVAAALLTLREGVKATYDDASGNYIIDVDPSEGLKIDSNDQLRVDVFASQLTQSISSPPTQTEVQNIQDKLNTVINALKS